MSGANHARHTTIRQAVIDWLLSLEMEYFITFNFNQGNSLHSARRSLKRFHARLDRKLLGAGFNRLSTDRRTLMIAFPEHIESNLHYHALVKSPSPRLTDVATAVWQHLVPSGSLYVSDWRGNGSNATKFHPLLGDTDANRIARYITKEVSNSLNYENFLIFKRVFYPLK